MVEVLCDKQTVQVEWIKVVLVTFSPGLQSGVGCKQKCVNMMLGLGSRLPLNKYVSHTNFHRTAYIIGKVIVMYHVHLPRNAWHSESPI